MRPGKQDTVWSGALEVSRENTGEVERMKNTAGWVLTIWGKVNLLILEQFRVLNPSLEDGPVLLQASLYSIHSLLCERRRIFFTTSELTGPAGSRRNGKGKGDFEPVFNWPG